MKAILICPAERSELEAMVQQWPLAVAPLLGKCLAQYWVEHLASLGAKEILLLASDRPEEVRNVLGNGNRWGVKLEVIPEPDELTVQEARAKYLKSSYQWLPAPHDVLVMENLPGQAGETSMLRDYAAWFSTVAQFLPRTVTPDRVGLREAGPGVWTGLRTRISSKATLHPPCWIGDDVFVGPDATIGPNAIIENRVFVERGAEILNSHVLAETYVGALTEVRDSLVMGDCLINWKTGSAIQVPDPFILSGLNKNFRKIPRPNLLGRLTAFLAFIGMAPLALLMAAKLKLKNQPAFRRLRAIRPDAGSTTPPREQIHYYEMLHPHKWIRRWPQLLNIARGEFCWVGNRPLTPSEAVLLKTDFDRLWLAAPIGFLSLGDVQGAVHPASDDARAHASFYAVQRSRSLNLTILRRALMAPKREETPTAHGEEFAMPFKADAVEGNRLT